MTTNSLAAQIALTENELLAARSEVHQLTNKLTLATAETDRLTADHAQLTLRLEAQIRSNAELQALIDGAMRLLGERFTIQDRDESNVIPLNSVAPGA